MSARWPDLQDIRDYEGEARGVGVVAVALAIAALVIGALW